MQSNSSSRTDATALDLKTDYTATDMAEDHPLDQKPGDLGPATQYAPPDMSSRARVGIRSLGIGLLAVGLFAIYLAMAMAGLRENLDETREEAQTALQEMNMLLLDMTTSRQAAESSLLETSAALSDAEDALTDERHMQTVLQEDKIRLQRGFAAATEREVGLHYELRQPLTLGPDNSYWSEFSCTGSMEPVITCLDDALWLTAFQPEDIVVGSIISFHPACWEERGEDESGTSHRVMDIKVEDGVHYYWPQGDNNPEDDGCWVPETDVHGYIIYIDRGVYPENAKLRDSVNAAEEAYRLAVAAYDDALADAAPALKAAEDAYIAVRVRHGCPSFLRVTCDFTAQTAYDEITDAYRLYSDARSAAEGLVGVPEIANAEKVVNIAWGDVTCWQKNARDSEYPGHLPHEC